MDQTLHASIPGIGSVVRVRARRFLVEGVEADAAGGPTLVRLACIEDDAQGEPLAVLWEHEHDAEVMSGESWGNVAKRGFDKPHLFSAFLHTLRWNCVTSTDEKLFQSPYRAGIKVHAYQLEPLRKALQMPRVNLFIADDVGLGKTIEAGLIMRELLMRQRVRRIVIASPRSVVLQWRDEMEQRFGLPFVVLDREYIARMRVERGFGVNPWNTHNRFIISHNLIRDEAYTSTLRDWLGDFAPGSLLVLDEAHNAAPASGSRYAVDSNLTKTIRQLAPAFEHRLFLSATPHNGHSNSFSALMSLLDPQRFLPGEAVEDSKLLDHVMVRRLKSDLRGLGQNFPERKISPEVCDGLSPDAPELKLSRLLQEYREVTASALSGAAKTRQNASRLVITSLQKRLLSSIDAFYRTLCVHKGRLLKRQAEATARFGAEALEPPGAEDERADQSEAELEKEQDLATDALSAEARGSDELPARARALLTEMETIAQSARFDADPRIKKLEAWIRANMCPGLGKPGAQWNDRRVIIFTEYTDTKGYLVKQLGRMINDADQAEDRVGVFHGGMDDESREAVKRAFNASPNEVPLRILVATDAAREGVNLQNYCYDLFHFDIPWNPSRMEQRNGRIDRQLQRAPQVFCRYFMLPQRLEDPVLEAIVKKLDTINRQLGVLSPVIDRKVESALKNGISHASVDALKQEISSAGASGDDAGRQKIIEQELESTRLRHQQLEKQLQTLDQMLNESRKWIGLDNRHFMAAISASLEMMQSEGLKAVDAVEAAKDPEHAPWRIPALHEKLGADPAWAGTLDSLRAPRKEDERVDQWRKESPIRPVVFSDPGTLDGKVVHLHLEHRVVQRLFSRFRSQGFLHHELSRACVVRTEDAIPRVVLFGRLALYGNQAARLHDEIVAVAAEWSPADTRGNRKLKPLPKDARDETLALLEDALGKQSLRDVPDNARNTLLAAAAGDVEDLRGHLERLAAQAAAGAGKELTRRGEREAKSMREILLQQKKRIEKELSSLDTPESKQRRLGFADDEERQFKAERRLWQRRLDAIPGELETEPARVQASFEVKSTRVEPVGVVYLWPLSR
ncbi:MAG: DISARM system SNF2-like helicase DrmD [Planctomycetes bacterium]|nr:DISARM system SNF2-like helicase DrmD [Planctomycetota bacterium]